jgi:hypothetical protein
MDPKNKRCGGFWAMVSNNATILFVSAWEQHMRRHPGHNQAPYNKKLRFSNPRVVDRPLPLEKFPHGNYFARHIARNPTKQNQSVAIHFSKY